MEFTAAETKVQIRLSTRDPGLQIAEEPTVLLVQTCTYATHVCKAQTLQRPKAGFRCFTYHI